LPGIVGIGNMEVKDPRAPPAFPQFLGQLLAQAINNYHANIADTDGSYR
jgi:hypothetical protein